MQGEGRRRDKTKEKAGVGKEGEREGRERGREEKRGRKETITFKFFLLLGTQRVTSFIVSDY